MKKQLIDEQNEELLEICNKVKDLIKKAAYEESKLFLKNAIGEYPHAPEPHNLLGILLVNEGRQILAMKHFRVAEVLDPTYLPARYNLELYGRFSLEYNPAFDEADCPQIMKRN
jgi:lipoprotein NlpI